MGCDELGAGEPGGDRATNRSATFGPLGEGLAHAAGVRIRERLARGLEHVVEGVGDPEPLERPGGEERGDARVLVRRGDQQVAHALHRRAFEVAQDPDEAGGVGGQRRLRELAQVELGAVAAAGGAGELPHVEQRRAWSRSSCRRRES